MPMLDEMERQFMTEFDFTREGWALEKIGNAVHKEFSGVTIPKPFQEYTSKRVVVMTRHDGVKLVDGINKYYEQLAAEQGKTMEQLRDEFKQEGLKTKKRGNPTAFQMELYRTYLRSKSLSFNLFAGLWNYTFGLALPNVQYMESNLPLNHVQIIDKLLAVHGDD
jgi:aarF domain-containing kinase